MYFYAHVSTATQIVESFSTESSLLPAEDFPDSHLVEAIDETWIQRKKWDAATQSFVDVQISETKTHNSLEYTHIDAEGTKHWLDVFINDMAENSSGLSITAISETGHNLNNYTEFGIYTFTNAAAPTNVPAGTNGWLVVIPWEEGSSTIKQLWFRHGTAGSNDFETYVRTKIGSDNTWGSWSKYYTTSNPPTAAEVGATPAFTNATGGVEFSYGSGSGKNVLTEINAMPQGLHTLYAIGGTTGNPKTTESWRYLVHKTSATIGWIIAFGSSGSIYTNYQNAANTFTGWVCHYDDAPAILWMGDYWITETQTVTPSKKLSECRNGWVLVWSDYDVDTEEPTNGDCFTTVIPKKNTLHANWSGQNMVAAVPTYLNDSGVLTWVGKRLYVYDDKITGHAVNHVTAARDVALRAIYEY